MKKYISTIKNAIVKAFKEANEIYSQNEEATAGTYMLH